MMSSQTGPPDFDPAALIASMRWALDESTDPALSTVNWIASDIVPGCRSVSDMLTSSDTTVDQLVQAKDVFKTMRMIGETAPERRLAARLYAATIAAAIVHHDSRISRQSDAAIHRALARLAGDVACPDSLRDLIRAALKKLGTP